MVKVEKKVGETKKRRKKRKEDKYLEADEQPKKARKKLRGR